MKAKEKRDIEKLFPYSYQVYDSRDDGDPEDDFIKKRWVWNIDTNGQHTLELVGHIEVETLSYIDCSSEEYRMPIPKERGTILKILKYLKTNVTSTTNW